MHIGNRKNEGKLCMEKGYKQWGKVHKKQNGNNNNNNNNGYFMYGERETQSVNPLL